MIESSAKKMAGNWRKFSCFVWNRGYDLEDADHWMIWYTSGRDVGLLEQSNHQEIAKLLHPFTQGDDPDVVAESHSHWAVGHVDGFSIRVYGKDGNITDAFGAYCDIKKRLDAYPVLNESDYSEKEYEATLENYRSEMWDMEKELPEGWASEVYSWFSDNGHDRFTENRDDQGGDAPKENILEALQDLGLLPTVVLSSLATGWH
jgi:hypothetical protein